MYDKTAYTRAPDTKHRTLMRNITHRNPAQKSLQSVKVNHPLKSTNPVINGFWRHKNHPILPILTPRNKPLGRKDPRNI